MPAVGDPGAGKSSLLRAVAQLAMVRRRRVLSVTPTRFEQGLPFAGLAELIGQLPEGADSGLPGPQRRALAAALQRAEPGGGDALAVPLAVRGLLTQLCESGPVALIIDDLQWLDQASAGSLGFALRRISNMARVLVKEYAGNLEAARELAQGAVARARPAGRRRPLPWTAARPC